MKTDKNHTEEIAYAVRATRSAVYRELGLTGQGIADRIGTTRQGAAKKSPVTRITPIIPAQLALYDYETQDQRLALPIQSDGARPIYSKLVALLCSRNKVQFAGI